MIRSTLSLAQLLPRSIPRALNRLPPSSLLSPLLSSSSSSSFHSSPPAQTYKTTKGSGRPDNRRLPRRQNLSLSPVQLSIDETFGKLLALAGGGDGNGNVDRTRLFVKMHKLNPSNTALNHGGEERLTNDRDHDTKEEAPRNSYYDNFLRLIIAQAGSSSSNRLTNEQLSQILTSLTTSPMLKRDTLKFFYLPKLLTSLESNLDSIVNEPSSPAFLASILKSICLMNLKSNRLCNAIDANSEWIISNSKANDTISSIATSFAKMNFKPRTFYTVINACGGLLVERAEKPEEVATLCNVFGKMRATDPDQARDLFAAVEMRSEWFVNYQHARSILMPSSPSPSPLSQSSHCNILASAIKTFAQLRYYCPSFASHLDNHASYLVNNGTTQTLTATILSISVLACPCPNLFNALYNVREQFLSRCTDLDLCDIGYAYVLSTTASNKDEIKGGEMLLLIWDEISHRCSLPPSGMYKKVKRCVRNRRDYNIMRQIKICAEVDYGMELGEMPEVLRKRFEEPGGNDWKLNERSYSEQEEGEEEEEEEEDSNSSPTPPPSQPTTTPQQRISSLLSTHLSFPNDNEVPIIDPTSTFMACDIVSFDHNLVIEVQGVLYHSVIDVSSGTGTNSNDDDGRKVKYITNGQTRMKRRLLEGLGWVVKEVDLEVWKDLRLLEEQVEYLEGIVGKVDGRGK